MNAPARPLMNYYGGKFNLADWIVSHFPPHRVYVEAFGGALSVFMRKDPVALEIVNDKDLQIVSLYRHVRSASHHLALLLELTPYSRHEYYSAKDRALSIEDTRKTLVASYMGVGNSLASSTNGFRNSASSNCAPSRSWANYVDEFERFHERIRESIIECLDYAKLFEKYDSPETLWYLDPPYVQETRSDQHAKRGYRCDMKNSDQRKLIKRVQSLKGMVVLSGYESNIYSALPWSKVTTEARTQRGGTRMEVLWLNPACVKAQAQQKLF